MKLVIAIVQSADSGKLTDALVERGFRSTRINTVGGFLDEPNITMLIVTEDEQLPDLMDLIRHNCQARRRYMNAAPMSVETAGMPVVTAAPIEVEVGGATVFVLPLRHLARLGQTGQLAPSGLSGKTAMLMLAVVRAEEANDVIAALTRAGFRLTRLNSVGSFLKRGSATLLMGVRADYVDKALELIQKTCRQREEPNPAKSGMPMFTATAFIIGMEMLPLPGLAADPS